MQRLIISICLFVFSFTTAHALDAVSYPKLNIAVIQKQLRIKGVFDQKDNLYKITVPRSDLAVVVNGIKLNAEQSLNSWVNFQKSGVDVALTGDLILSPDQVNPVMSVALANQIEVLSLYSPFIWESPRIVRMHIKAQGNEYRLASAVEKIFNKIKTTTHGRGDFPFVSQSDLESSVSGGQIHSVLGGKFSTKDGVHHFAFNKKNPGTWATFSGSNAHAIVEGNVAVSAAELQKTLLSLRKSDFFVVAIYQQEINPESNLVYIHYWGLGNAFALAKTVRNTLVLAQSQTVKSRQNILYPDQQLASSPNSVYNAERWSNTVFPTVAAPAPVKNHVEAWVSTALGLEVRDSLYMIPSGLLHDLIAAQNKNYNYVAKLVKASPIIFSAQNEASIDGQHKKLMQKLAMNLAVISARSEKMVSIRQQDNLPAFAMLAINGHHSSGIYKPATWKKLSAYKLKKKHSTQTKLALIHAKKPLKSSLRIVRNKTTINVQFPLYTAHSQVIHRKLAVADKKVFANQPAVYPFDGVAKY